MMHVIRVGLMLLVSGVSMLHAASALIKAASEGNNRAIVSALKGGEKINECDSNGWTPLAWAVYYRQLSSVQLLLQKGADPNIQTTGFKKYIYKGSTPLMIAAKDDQWEIMNALIAAGAKADFKDSQGEDAESLARKKRYQGALRALGIKIAKTPALDRMLADIEGGKDINALGKEGWTILHWAAYEGDYLTAEELLQKGMKPDIPASSAYARSETGATPLIVAAQSNQYQVIDVLLRANANRQCKDSAGRTAEDYILEDESWGSQDVMLDRSPLKGRYSNLAVELSCNTEKDTKQQAADLAMIREKTVSILKQTALFERVDNGKEWANSKDGGLQLSVQFSQLEIDPKVKSPSCRMTIRCVEAVTGKVEREQRIVLTTNFWEGELSDRIDRFIDGVASFISDYIILVTGRIQPISVDESCVDLDKSAIEARVELLASTEMPVYTDQYNRAPVIYTPKLSFRNLRLWSWIDAFPSPYPVNVQGFKLSMLQKQKLAIWPIMRLDFDNCTKTSVISNAGSEAKALTALSGKFSNTLIRLGSPESLSEEQVIKMLEGDSLRTWLYPKRILPGSGSLLLSNLQLAPDFKTLCRQGGLQGIKYAVVPHRMQALRVVGTGGGEMTYSLLSLSVIDLEKRQTIWNGSFNASVKSTWQQERALKQNEDALLLALEKAIKADE